MTAAPELPVRPVEPIQTNSTGMRVAIGFFVAVPLLAVAAAIPVAWGGWLSWTDVILMVVFYLIAASGVTLGLHRYFTHGGFKTNRFMKIVLAVMGSLSIEGSVAQWVADHRKHHKFSDEIGDPHSPWRFGTSRRAIGKGLVYAHVGWLFDASNSPVSKYAPDIINDRDLRAISRWFPAFAIASVVLPGIIGGLITWSWLGALTALFWAGLIRIALVHHVTWSINSICHVFGSRPFDSRDLSTNNAWLAIPALGESWHSLHHAEPTAARHGVFKGQVDLTANMIWVMEKLHIVSDVRWPKPERIVAKLNDPSMAHRVRGYVAPAPEQAPGSLAA